MLSISIPPGLIVAAKNELNGKTLANNLDEAIATGRETSIYEKEPPYDCRRGASP